MINPWTSPPGNTWETTDIWVDSPVNGYGNYRYGMWSDLAGGVVPVGNGDDPAVGQPGRLTSLSILMTLTSSSRTRG